jgi:transcriptional regulator NrdR family protein
MMCPVCGKRTKVTDSKADCESVQRTRECLKCGYRFKTLEYEEVYVNGRKNNDKDRKN